MGGGETLALDRHIVSLTGKPHPRALFLPTASFDDGEYGERFQFVYGNRLGCSVDIIKVWENYSREEIEATIQATKWDDHPHVWEFRGNLRTVEKGMKMADLVYVGGGNTKRMLELWRSIGVDRMLREAADRGVVLSGLSAGCICWGRYGNSDFALTEDLGKPTGRIDGLDFLPVALCPHMSREGFRLEEFKAMMRTTPGMGIGLDDGCALEFIDGQYRILSCIEGAAAHRVTAIDHDLIEPFEDARPL